MGALFFSGGRAIVAANLNIILRLFCSVAGVGLASFHYLTRCVFQG